MSERGYQHVRVNEQRQVYSNLWQKLHHILVADIGADDNLADTNLVNQI